MKKRGFSIINTIVFVGLIALIVWGLNYLITKSPAVAQTPSTTVSSNSINTDPAPIVAPIASSTPTPTSAQATKPIIVATSNAPKNSTATSTPKAPPISPVSSALTVTFTDKGFSPASLTVKKGQTVTFVNNSSGKMWVAANPFPTSSEYPAFNEKSGADSGSSWDFTFDKVGTWFYHSHYSPAQGAKIVVSP